MTDEGEGSRSTRLLTGPVAWFMLCAFCAMANFYLLMSVLPLDASRAGTGAAGLVTGISMLGCVVTEVLFGTRVGRLGHIPAMLLGATLLAVPDAMLAGGRSLPPVEGLSLPVVGGQGLPLLLGASLVRGVGLAVLVVAGTGIAAAVAPHGRRGESLGLYGIAVSLPGALALPAGVWVAHEFGFRAVYLLALGLGALAVVLAFLIPRRGAAGRHAGGGFRVLLQARARRPALVFLTTTIAAGIYASFLPIAMAGTPAGLISAALLAQTAAAAVTRWAAGRAGDRIGTRRLLVPAVLTGVAGAVLATAVWEPLFVVVGMLLFGVGFGALQNLTLAMMYEGVRERDFGSVSTVWNTAYDSGMGAGAVGFGFLSQASGFPLGLAATAVVLALGVAPAVRDSADRGHPPTLNA